MKLSKEQFIKHINCYEQMLNQENEILNILGGIYEWAPSDWINSFYDLFSEMCELKENPAFGTSLDWFCFDTGFGEYNNIIKLKEEDDGAISEIKINGAAALYDYLVTYEIPSYEKEN